MSTNPHRISGVESEHQQPPRSSAKPAPAETFDQKPRMTDEPFKGVREVAYLPAHRAPLT